MNADQQPGFDPGFAWGTAASAPESEGAARVDGKGESVWDMFCRKPGATWDGSNADVASDVYHHYAEDAGLMKQVGLTAARISVSWTRVLPEGVGTPNAKGLDFYDRYVDTLLEAGVEPTVNLFHWDYPLELYYRGGWLNRDSVEWFADYTDLVVRELGDRVSNWMTYNEPAIFVGRGHGEGSEAPGDRLAQREVLRVGHHALLAHGRGVQAIRAGCPGSTRVGLALNGPVDVPASDSEADIAAARSSMFSITGKPMRNNTWFADPIYLGRYPADGWELYGPDVPEIRDGDLELVSQPLDYFPSNVYSGRVVRAGEDGDPQILPHDHERTYNTWGWPVVPETLYWGPKFYHERYGVPVDITENGWATREWVGLDGAVHDFDRIDYVRRHLLQLREAIRAGVPVGGYFMWTFVDDYCWTEAFKDRMGFVYRNAETQERTMKDSGRWFAEVIRTNGAAIDTDPVEILGHTASPADG